MIKGTATAGFLSFRIATGLSCAHIQSQNCEMARFLPKKAAAAIRKVPHDVGKVPMPPELARVINKTFQRTGVDIAANQEVFAPLIDRFAKEFKGGSIADAFDHASELFGSVTRDNPTFSAVVPIVLEHSNTKHWELIGSGVLIRILHRIFLLTAAHVADRRGEGVLLMPGGQGFMQIAGRFSSTRLPDSGQRTDDNLDVAYFALDESCADGPPPHCTILGGPDLLFEAESLRRLNFTLGGFPWRKAAVVKRVVETSFYTFTGVEAGKSQYDQLGLAPSTHIVLRFNRRRSYHTDRRTVGTSPLPSGISGGGVFAWSKDALATWPARLPLAGIITEFRAAKSLLIATRLHVPLRAILHHHPDLVDMLSVSAKASP